MPGRRLKIKTIQKDNKINFYSKSEKDHISELLMIVDGNEDAVVLSMVGNIDLSRIAKLGSALDMGGMKYLGKMDNSTKESEDE